MSEKIREFVERGGFLFAMCGATETLELAIAGHNVDLAQSFIDGTPMDADADRPVERGHLVADRAGRVAVAFGTNKLRQARDEADIE